MVRTPFETLARAFVALGVAAGLMLAAIAARGAVCDTGVERPLSPRQYIAH